jgi:multiple sugar transport system substrate-binding protein
VISGHTTGHRRGRRRWAAALAVPLALAVGPAAQGLAAATDAPEEVTLRFAWWGGDSRHTYTQELIDIYEADNPHVTIEPEFADFADYWNRLATTVAGGDTPDIIQQDVKYVREYADRGVLADLNAYLGTEIDDSALDPTMLEAGAVGDATYAIPTGVNALGLVADPVAFEEAGVEMPDDTTWMWDEFVDIGTQISEATGGEVFGAQDKGFNESNLEVYLRQHGEALFNEDGTALGFTPERMAEWWQIGLDQRDAGATPPASVTVEVEAGGIDLSLLSTNTGAMGFWWSNQLGALAEGSGRELQLLRFPGGSEGMFLKPAMLWSMSADTEHPEEAARFINFLLNDERAAEIMLIDRGLPVNLEMREAITDALDPANQLAAEFVNTVGEEAAAPPGIPPQGAGEVQVILQRLNEEVLFDQMSVEDAVQAFIDEANAAIGA